VAKLLRAMRTGRRNCRCGDDGAIIGKAVLDGGSVFLKTLTEQPSS
jgi:hypothetical protein